MFKRQLIYKKDEHISMTFKKNRTISQMFLKLQNETEQYLFHRTMSFDVNNLLFSNGLFCMEQIPSVFQRKPTGNVTDNIVS